MTDLAETWRRAARAGLLVGAGLAAATLAAVILLVLAPIPAGEWSAVVPVLVPTFCLGIGILCGAAAWLALRGLLLPGYSLRRKRVVLWSTLAGSALLVVPFGLVALMGVFAVLVGFLPLGLVGLLVAATVFGFGWYCSRSS